ncbi:hypothetical protein [Staphylococcus saprophyticus]|uniref:hypothetical protein n=1 Tax=Staphylococcus saprophyticus TaxID=29385 RepID=UPI001642D759|nr:hypothetical protein [Staphylococcus saprophyticus]
MYYRDLWDGERGVEERIEVMNDLIEKGKIGYWGVCNYRGWGLGKRERLGVGNDMGGGIGEEIY